MMYKYLQTSFAMEDEDETIIDLSKHSVSEACHWLIDSLGLLKFMHLAYTIPFCNYVLTWPKAVPLEAILILQSPYPRNIFPPVAAAMSYDTELCKKMMENREMPPTIQVLVNDLYINGGMNKEDSIAILKNGWALVEKGILMVNEAVFYTHNRDESYIEAAKQCAVIIRLLRETERYGKRVVDVYAFGEVGEKVGSNLCSWYKSSTVRLTKRKVGHPAGVARRFDNLDDPNCHMNTPSFSKSLVKCFRNHVAFMHTMAKKPVAEQEIKYQRQQDILRSIYDTFPKHEQSLITFRDLNRQAMETPQSAPEHKEILRKLDSAVDELATRFRITASIVNNLQVTSGSISSNVSKAGPSSMKQEAPSISLLSQHTGQEHSPASAISSTGNLKIKPAKPRKVSTPADESSFSVISEPQSVTSVNNEGSQLKIKPAKSRNITPLKNVTKQTTSQSDSVQRNTSSQKNISMDDEEVDTLSPLANKFANKMRIPQPKGKQNTSSSSNNKMHNSKALSPEHIQVLSCVAAVVESHKSDLDEDDRQALDNIQNDIMAKTIYNGIVERLIPDIDKDISDIPGFNFINWAMDATKPSATFEKCKEEFYF